MQNLPTELLLDIGSRLKTCKDISSFCLANKNIISPLDFTKELVAQKNRNINVDAMIYRLLCNIIEDNSQSNLGDYKNGKGMYQETLIKYKNETLTNLINFTDLLRKLNNLRSLSNEEDNSIRNYIRDNILEIGDLFSSSHRALIGAASTEFANIVKSHPVYKKLQKLSILLHEKIEKSRLMKSLNSLQLRLQLQPELQQELQEELDDLQQDFDDILLEEKFIEFEKNVYPFLKTNYESFIDVILRYKKRGATTLDYIYKK